MAFCTEKVLHKKAVLPSADHRRSLSVHRLIFVGLKKTQMMKISLHDLLLRHEVVVPEKHDLKFERNIERFVPFSENRIKRLRLDDVVMSERADGKMVIHSGGGQLLFAVTLLCALVGRLYDSDENIPVGARLTFRDMVKDECRYKLQIEGRVWGFFRDFVINRIPPGKIYPPKAGKFWLSVYRLFAFTVSEREADEIQWLIEALSKAECRVHQVYLN